jgi:hypothetical protein
VRVVVVSVCTDRRSRMAAVVRRTDVPARRAVHLLAVDVDDWVHRQLRQHGTADAESQVSCGVL